MIKKIEIMVPQHSWIVKIRLKLSNWEITGEKIEKVGSRISYQKHIEG